MIAVTLPSVNICMRSAARSRSLPARKPQRLRTLRASLGLKPSCSRASMERSMAFGSGGALAGAMMPMVSPEPRRWGLMGMELKLLCVFTENAGEDFFVKGGGVSLVDSQAFRVDQKRRRNTREPKSGLKPGFCINGRVELDCWLSHLFYFIFRNCGQSKHFEFVAELLVQLVELGNGSPAGIAPR